MNLWSTSFVKVFESALALVGAVFELICEIAIEPGPSKMARLLVLHHNCTMPEKILQKQSMLNKSKGRCKENSGLNACPLMHPKPQEKWT